MSNLRDSLLSVPYLNEDLDGSIQIYFFEEDTIKKYSNDYVLKESSIPIVINNTLNEVYVRPHSNLNDSNYNTIKTYFEEFGYNKIIKSKLSHTAQLFNEVLNNCNGIKLPIEPIPDEAITEAINEAIEESLEPISKSIEKSIPILDEKITLSETIKKEDNVFDRYFHISETSIKPEKELTLKEQIMGELKSEMETQFNQRMTKISQTAFNKNTIVGIGGGGTVAKQYANGGTMNGNLTVNGTIEANAFIPLNPVILITDNYIIPPETTSGTTFVLSASYSQALSADNDLTITLPNSSTVESKKWIFKAFTTTTISCWGDQKMDGTDNSKILGSPNSITLEKFGKLPDVDWIIQ